MPWKSGRIRICDGFELIQIRTTDFLPGSLRTLDCWKGKKSLWVCYIQRSFPGVWLGKSCTDERNCAGSRFTAILSVLVKAQMTFWLKSSQLDLFNSPFVRSRCEPINDLTHCRQVVSLSAFSASKSESIGQLMAANMAAVNGGAGRASSDKKSLASKLSGTLNRNNSGKNQLRLFFLLYCPKDRITRTLGGTHRPKLKEILCFS